MSRHPEALPFRIWREGNAVRWDCTAAELAQAVGCHVSTVRRIAAERGWPVLPAGTHGPTDHPPVDHFLAGRVGRSAARTDTGLFG